MYEDQVVVGGMSELEVIQVVEYKTVPGFTEGQYVRIGSLTAGDMIEWSEANEGEAKRTAGLRLICKSLCNAEGVRYALDLKNIATFRRMSHKSTEALVKEILILNGLRTKGDDAAKKD